MMHSAVLLKADVKALQAVNEQKKRRKRKRKRRIMQGIVSLYKRERISFRLLRLMHKSAWRWQVRVVGRWVLRADRSAMADVRRSDIIPVRARGARNQLQLNKGHYVGWHYSSASLCSVEPHNRQWAGRAQERPLCHWKHLLHWIVVVFAGRNRIVARAPEKEEASWERWGIIWIPYDPA
jgi:hypothetical protein